MLAQSGEELIRTKRPVQDDRTAVKRVAQPLVFGADVIERHGQREPVGGLHQGLESGDQGGAHLSTVREHYAFRASSGSAGIDEEGDIVGLNNRRGRLRLLRRQSFLVALPRSIAPNNEDVRTFLSTSGCRRSLSSAS